MAAEYFHVGRSSPETTPTSGNEQTIAGRDPIMAIVSLRNQQITVYDANGWILRAPVSSGQKGRETPAGVFSVIQKEAEHYLSLTSIMNACRKKIVPGPGTRNRQ